MQSVQTQAYPHWELSLAAEGEPSSELLEKLSEVARHAVKPSEDGTTTAHSSVARFRKADPWDGIGICAGLAVGGGESFRPAATRRPARRTRLFELRRCSRGIRKPTWSTAMKTASTPRETTQNRSSNPTGRPSICWPAPPLQNLSLFRSSLVLEMGGLCPEFAGAAIYDLALRLSTRSAAIRIFQMCCTIGGKSISMRSRSRP